VLSNLGQTCRIGPLVATFPHAFVLDDVPLIGRKRNYFALSGVFRILTAKPDFALGRLGCQAPPRISRHLRLEPEHFLA